MASILIMYLTLAYIFSGFICWLAVVKFNHRSLTIWQCPLIVTLWPIWILLEIKS